jgi:CubicO group peptidase (beta-lactamase class C family)
MERLASLPLLHQPGTVWDYSLSIDVLGLVVEQLTEQRLGVAMENRIFRPLGMADTGFLVPQANRARYATALPTDPTSGQPQNVDMGLIAPQFECGGGCAVSTAADYIRFAQMLLNGGALDGRRVLSRASVAEMTRDHMHAGLEAPGGRRAVIEGLRQRQGKQDARLHQRAGLGQRSFEGLAALLEPWQGRRTVRRRDAPRARSEAGGRVHAHAK